jgi:hypothetical protein
MFDLACNREARRDEQGYVTPAQARAFLQSARQLRLDIDQPPPNPISRAYFRAIAQVATGDGNPPRDGAGDAGGVPPGSAAAADSGVRADGDSSIGADAIAGVIEVLREAGVLTQPRALLAAAEKDTTGLALIRAYVESHAGPEEVAFLANTLIAGCSIQERPFRPQEAYDAVVAVCNLGLENWPPHWRDRDLVMAFQVGWTVLHRQVCLYAAERLIEVVAHIECPDRDIQMRLNGLRRHLTRHLPDGAPWRARSSMDVIVMLDAPCWAALLALIDECPVIHAGVSASRGSRQSVNAGEFEFISRNSQIESIRGFMESLPCRLTL